MSDDRVNVCLGNDQELFIFSPSKVHDLYAEANTLYIELVVDGAFIATYTFDYDDIGDLLVDFKAISKEITSKEASQLVA